ncbi:hypothetical protein EG329_000124 [Mollisiaceae sp. DMI_Dod_QoI]|nr:hypothetical protein EG329_000124 [Helotiales sp. DMI_Dod_QoI]
MKICIFLVVNIFALAISADVPAFSMPLKEAAARLDEMYKQATNTILQNLDVEEKAMRDRGEVANCTRSNIAIRMEFGSMKKEDRRAYTNAVLCLQSKKAITPAVNTTGTKTRFDDFITTHIWQTPMHHASGTFLGWHRYYIWVYEQSLRTECGYEGPIPYWDWPKWAEAPQDSPLFNGDEYSMSGNGEFIPNRPAIISIPIPIPNTDRNLTADLEIGLGGGCVTSGPFKNMTVNLGPKALGWSPAGPDGGLGYNPRCLKRDIGPAIAMKYTNYTVVLDSMNSTTIKDFQDGIGGRPIFGPHGGGHYTISGDPGQDFWVSPGDPAFYLHHGQIDRLWTLWQALDPQNRQYALSGTNTMMDIPPSPNTTLDHTINVGYAGGKEVAMQDIMSTTKGPFCYMYM